MSGIVAIPLPLRLVGLALIGAAIGAFVNWVVDRIRWQPTFLSPWHRLRSRDVPRRAAHRIPIWGWLARGDETATLGRGFWWRPLLVELGMALFVPVLYYYETVVGGLIAPARAPQAMLLVHWEFLSHLILSTLMLIASLVDFDDKIIPDRVTVPGTLLGILIATITPDVFLPNVYFDQARRIVVDLVHLGAPRDFPAALDGRPHVMSLVLGVGCFVLWCVGLMPRVWRTGRGLRTCIGLFVGRLRNEPVSYRIALMAIVGTLGISAVWWPGGVHWAGLLTALVGMAVTGGFTWLIRVVAGASIGREALGFGDVTLMAMIGSFLGWQAGLIVFFVAPFFGLLLGLLQWIVKRDPELPYGPHLCLAALTVIVGWPTFWEIGFPIFLLGWILPAILVAAVALMGAMLWTWHWVLGR